MAVICGVVGVSIAPDRDDVLDGVLAAFEPHGSRTSSRTLRVGRRTAVVAGRSSANEDVNLAVEPGFGRDDHGTDDGGVTVVGDVRLDHRDELATRLASSPSCTDVELVLRAYLRWGDQCIDRLYGDFAFAVLDPHRGGVLLVRDHAGRRSLVIHERPGLLAFSTTALALTGLDGVGHHLDTERVAEMLALAYGSERTLIEGVRFVEPGTAVWIDDTDRRQWRWWDPDPDDIDDLGSLDAHAEALRAAFDAAVASRLRTPGRPGVMLSGGLDSTSVAATAASLLLPDQLRTYTSVPPSGWVGHGDMPWDASEQHLVEALAVRHPNLLPRYIDVSMRDPFEHHEALWELGAGPTRNTMNVMWVFALNEEAAADGVTAMLTGAFGNAAFSADGQRWLIELARRGRLVRTAGELRAWSRARDMTVRRAARIHLLAPAVPRWARRVQHRWGDRPDRSHEWLGSTALRSDQAERLDLAMLIPTMGDTDSSRWTRRPTTMMRTGAAQAETRVAFSAWWGLDNRDPTSDRKLLEVALAQPEWWRRHRGVDRAVVRAAMADRLPTEIIDRRRRGAQLPDWFDRLNDARHDVENEIEEMRDHPPSRELIDVDRLAGLAARWPRREDAVTAEATRDYRLALPRSLMISRYLRWFEQRSRRIAAGGPTVVVPER